MNFSAIRPEVRGGGSLLNSETSKVLTKNSPPQVLREYLQMTPSEKGDQAQEELRITSLDVYNLGSRVNE